VPPFPQFELREVRFATGLPAANQSVAWIEARLGVFEQHGLAATFPRLEVTGPETVAGQLFDA